MSKFFISSSEMLFLLVVFVVSVFKQEVCVFGNDCLVSDRNNLSRLIIFHNIASE